MPTRDNRGQPREVGIISHGPDVGAVLNGVDLLRFGFLMCWRRSVQLRLHLIPGSDSEIVSSRDHIRLKFLDLDRFNKKIC